MRFRANTAFDNSPQKDKPMTYFQPCLRGNNASRQKRTRAKEQESKGYCSTQLIKEATKAKRPSGRGP